MPHESRTPVFGTPLSDSHLKPMRIIEIFSDMNRARRDHGVEIHKFVYILDLPYCHIVVANIESTVLTVSQSILEKSMT